MERHKDLSNGLTQPLLEKLRLSHGWAQLIVAETDTHIQLDGRLITLQNFKGQFTSAPAEGNLDHKVQHFTEDLLVIKDHKVGKVIMVDLLVLLGQPVLKVKLDQPDFKVKLDLRVIQELKVKLDHKVIQELKVSQDHKV